MIESTRVVVENLLAAHPASSLDTLYVTGGGAELPPVARVLRENFGRKVRRSAYMRSASAIGLAIRAADATDGDHGQVHDQFNRNFGIWRETDHGDTIVFDLIFPRGVALPAPGQPPTAPPPVVTGQQQPVQPNGQPPNGLQPTGQAKTPEQLLHDLQQLQQQQQQQLQLQQQLMQQNGFSH